MWQCHYHLYLMKWKLRRESFPQHVLFPWGVWLPDLLLRVLTSIGSYRDQWETWRVTPTAPEMKSRLLPVTIVCAWALNFSLELLYCPLLTVGFIHFVLLCSPHSSRSHDLSRYSCLDHPKPGCSWAGTFVFFSASPPFRGAPYVLPEMLPVFLHFSFLFMSFSVLIIVCNYV